MTSDSPLDSTEDDFAALVAEVAERAGADLGEDRVRIPLRLPASWSQGRATFGGLQAGLALAGLARRVAAIDGTRSLRSMQVEFVGPVSGAAELELELLRSGRSATLVRASILAQGAIAMTLSACFGGDRESAITIAGAPAPALRGPEGLVGMPMIEGLTPGFVRYIELRWALGGFPGAQVDDAARSAGWVRTREPFAVSPTLFLPALIDAWPVPAQQHFRMPVPASSVSWSVDFVGLAGLDPSARSEDWWIYEAETDGAGAGWVHTRARLWTASGQLVATSRQTVAIYG